MAELYVTKQQRANALAARFEMWPTVPRRNVVRGLMAWRGDEAGDAQPSCNSVGCFGGWCAWWPAFRAQGLKSMRDGMPYIDAGTGDSDDDLCGTLAADFLFGDNALFFVRDSHPADPGYDDPDAAERSLKHVSDHDIVRRRLDWLIRNSEVVG